MERIEFISDEEYLEVLTLLHTYLCSLELESETPAIASTLTQGRKAILSEIISLKSDSRKKDMTYGWRPVMIEFISRMSEKLEGTRYFKEAALLRAFYVQIEKKVVEMVVNNKIAEMSRLAHRDYLNERRGGISR